MAIFTAIATAFFAGTALAGTFAVTALAGVLSFGASIAISYAARALSGNQSQPEAAVSHFSAQGTLQAGGDVARSFQLGYSSTAGSLVYANTWGQNGETPNAYFTQVIALQDLPGGSLVEVWINGELCPLGTTADAAKGYPVPRYAKDGVDHLWVKFIDGTQTSADSFLVTNVASIERPYESSRVGYGVAYVICTALVEDTLFTGFPTYKFAVSGIPLYDISKDNSAGGSGTHRWSDRSTWGGDGDNLPAVQIYNLLRGVSYNGVWLYGNQVMSAARLPASNWIAQINKCRAMITGETGPEPTYRSGGQISVNAQTANAIEALLTACQGRIAEIGGFYKIHLGAPDSPVFSFSDGDILSTEEQSYRPFFALSDSVNGIAAKYPFPAEGWNTKVAPPLYRSDLEAKDGGRRLLANPSFDMVPYSAQAQRLMSSGLEEAQRARTHVITLPPVAWTLEPGDIISWSSVRNGYSFKSFRIDGVVDQANLDVTLQITEVDPSDYDWDHATDFEGVTSGSTFFERPSPQAILAFSAVGDVIKDADGLSRRPAIRLSWDGSLPGIAGVQWEVRLASDLSHVTRDRTDQLAAASILITQSLLPSTVYGVRAAYIPSSPRDMLWSDWLSATTPEVLLSLVEFEQAVQQQVTTVFDTLNDKLDFALQQIASISANQDARNWTDKKEVRSELSLRSNAAFAEITNTKTLLTAADAAMATEITTLFAGVAGNTSAITLTASTLATLSGSFTSYQTVVAAHFTATDANVTANASAISTLAGSLSSYVTTVTATATYATLVGLATTNANVTSNTSAVALLNGYAAAKYSVRLDVNGYGTGFDLINAGAGVSAFNIVADKFQIAQPGVGGGSLIPVFAIATVGGVTKLALRGDMVIDGSITAVKMSVGTLSSITANIGAVTAGTITGPHVSIDLNVGRILISD